ncbi:MAG: hypothetical protein RLZZ200_2838 [Pseudomonadota bacterium]|jgi:CheY-like chemotaxis protein
MKASSEGSFKDYQALLHGKRALVVDDDDVNRHILSDLLASAEIQTISARDGLEALCALESDRHIDIVLMDIHMPRMDGYEATKRIRAQVDLFQPRIIALTGFVTPEGMQRCLECGMDDFQAKPFTPDELFMKIAKALRLALPGSGATTRSPSGDSPAKPDFDPGVLQDLLENDAVELRQVAGKFVSAAEVSIEGMRAAIAAGAVDALRDLSHKHKSSAAMMGAHRFSAVCAEMEKRCRAGQIEGCDALIEELPAQLQLIRQAFLDGDPAPPSPVKP